MNDEPRTTRRGPQPINAIRTRVIETDGGMFEPQASTDGLNWSCIGAQCHSDLNAVRIAAEFMRMGTLPASGGRIVWTSEGQ